MKIIANLFWYLRKLVVFTACYTVRLSVGMAKGNPMAWKMFVLIMGTIVIPHALVVLAGIKYGWMVAICAYIGLCIGNALYRKYLSVWTVRFLGII